MTTEMARYIILQQPIRAKVFGWLLNLSFKIGRPLYSCFSAAMTSLFGYLFTLVCISSLFLLSTLIFFNLRKKNKNKNKKSLYIRTHIYIYIYIYSHIHTYIYIYIYVYSYIHTYMYTPTHKHTQSGRQLSNLPGPLIILLLPCQKHQSQLV